jgi:thioredoxin reductase
MSKHYDVVIIGGGASGLSAALVLARARRTVLVVDSGAPRNAPAAHMHGYLSRDGVPPGDFLSVGREEARGYGVTILDGLVTELEHYGTPEFLVALADGRQFSAQCLILATGLRDKLPNVPGLADRWARDVIHCPYCHGYEVRDQEIGVIGTSPDAVHYAQLVRQWTDDLVYFAPAGTVNALHRSELVARGIGIVEGEVKRVLVEDDRLCGVEMGDGRRIRRDALFVPPTFVPNGVLLVRLGCDLDEAGWPVSDSSGQTSVPGAWVAGNLANPRAQVITAASEGSVAAMAVNAALVDEDVKNAVRNSLPGL